ncbi:Inosine/uridine-preferring nucleoside hydrolase [Pleomassaria siparia CBS 279.74]|uniref:Inosine/uridine-preferring nucleoside hydrolase n=1 Tax=Pleomassaria siparia CBS 279.74 TaxID=1314801 RepID=A0A6G1JRP0_9PLEO|nr:Inosine/uridine-preferring nucleoside hydrolase [Pleomassaria siparia CBS 279.74]
MRAKIAKIAKIAKTALLPVFTLYTLTLAHLPHLPHSNSTTPLKVIIDTDFNTIGDDGQVLALAAQMHASHTIDLLGLTIVAGNQYLPQSVSDALKAIERVGLENHVGIYAGSHGPILHTYASYQLEQRLFGNATEYAAAYTSPPTNQIVAPPDGFATHTLPQKQHAVDFIIHSVHRYPNQISLLAIGPLTNIALAMRQDPSIVPLIKQTVIMGGQMYDPGNAYRGAGETNWWFDPEAARVVLRSSALVKKIIPLDVTNTVVMTNATYDEIAYHEPATPITTLFKDIERWGYVYDTVALASLVEPAWDADVRSLYVDVECDFGSDYGKGIVWDEDPYPGIELVNVSQVIFRLDNDRFFDLYVNLLTRPVPVVVA